MREDINRETPVLRFEPRRLENKESAGEAWVYIEESDELLVMKWNNRGERRDVDLSTYVVDIDKRGAGRMTAKYRDGAWEWANRDLFKELKMRDGSPVTKEIKDWWYQAWLLCMTGWKEFLGKSEWIGRIDGFIEMSSEAKKQKFLFLAEISQEDKLILVGLSLDGGDIGKVARRILYYNKWWRRFARKLGLEKR